MGRIQQLSDHVANQIAAGEVVERPASVVKELVENAIDAGARSIEIEFRIGGKRYIRITDDGWGMDREDAMLSLQRHATSKISTAKDLLALSSFGFRGEALPSIASVSKFTLKTRLHSNELGTEILIDGAAPPIVKDCGTHPGTTIEVARLFHTVPARRKFLKTDRTEAAHIIQLCRLFAVAHPEIAFSLIEDGNLRFRSPITQDRLLRIEEIFGTQVARELIPIQRSPDAESVDSIQISGFIGRPGLGRTTRAEMYQFVNLRPIESKVLHYAITESFHTYIPKGRHPLSFIFLDVDPKTVDVNVHPAKREVRFRDESQIRQHLMEQLLHTLREASETVLKRAQSVPTIQRLPILPSPHQPNENTSTRSEPIRTTPLIAPAASVRPNPPPPKAAPSIPSPETTASQPPKPPPLTPPSLNWTFISLFHDRFPLFETPDGTVILYPPAAQRRIRYEKMLRELEDNASQSQNLLFPQSLELDPIAANTLECHLDSFAKMGFQIDPFGRDFYRIHAIPAWIEPEHGLSLVRDLLDKIRENGLKPKENTTNELLARFTVEQSIHPRVSSVDKTAWLQLATELMACKQPLSDPSGRPTFFEMQHREWDKRLGLDT